MRHTYSSKRADGITILCIACIVIVVVGIALSIIVVVTNNANCISEGVIVDKHHSSAYMTITYSGSGNVKIAVPTYHPERYRFTIEGKKNGETVQYTFNVTEAEYDQYKIGDYYVR